MNDKIRKLQEQIRVEQQKIANCQHVFGKPFSNPEIVKEPYGFKYVGHGSDVWPEPEGYRDVSKPRWTRVCTLCGKEEHTYTMKPIITGSEPDFGK